MPLKEGTTWNNAYPFIFILMSHKSESAYKNFLQYLQSNVIDLKPTSVITDFECSLRNAFKRVYPTVKTVECWFHYTNALRRKDTQIPKFNRDKNAKNLFPKFMYLPLLKPANIIEAYSILKQDAMDVKFVNPSNNTENFFKLFINFFERQWMKKFREN
ncbi:PREDICTED: uncharacterized protein LOC108973641 [Bactrocera latifrons]|uniref:uncharacterized protein LOC108973641 n=1 Tax=Bactrocera latifrons TaxID=174628 RepID=UPI0008DDDFB2|nr:PREDICTED: uncharacterized protein LOC108973641 [Bactrocera latifrons]